MEAINASTAPRLQYGHLNPSPQIPTVHLNANAMPLPLVGMGTAEHPFDPLRTKSAVSTAIELGYRHFDTAAFNQSEKPLGDAIAEATSLGLIESRGEVFVTSKLWCTDCHPDLVLPAIRSTLRKLGMEYLDLYLIHWPMSLTPGPPAFPIRREDVVPMDLKGVWAAMEECQRLGLTRAIGVSNFTTNKLDDLLQFADIHPAVNQVEMNPVWQQHKLKEYCAERGIHITAYSPLGGRGRVGNNTLMDCQVLKEIAAAKGKTLAQVSLRWLYEQGVSFVVKSFNKERLEENLKIFDWELTDDDWLKIREIPQKKRIYAEAMLSNDGSLHGVAISDIDIVEI
ncbi:NAD(P)-linked oxidoreductase superfamily protein [Rhynchospora pubera]|uniref:NAD(P)-linked oxidoreductase superfamily protein n=1 Tax=Rhynchospora pubera TaxID=906938 RepID=A0AAV8HNX3_9POAL|nr:NAD(P)-linked oxidoreductase superfamily protein [Rhynchospora pubera]